jgi:membrane protease YdiL (CAAX protease family)
MMENTSPAATKPGGLRGILIGAKGLGPVWGVVIFIVILVASVLALELAVIDMIRTHKSAFDTTGPAFAATFEGCLAIIAAVTTLIVTWVEPRALVTLGFGRKNALSRLMQGLVIGALAMAALIGLLDLCGAIEIGRPGLKGGDMWRYGAQWGAAFLLVGVFEELTFRGYLQQTLARGLNFRWSALILGGFFTLAHAFNKGESPIGLGMVFVAGLVLSYSIWRTGTMWWAIGFHAAWDWMQSFTFGVADSGYPAVDALMTSKPAGPDWLSGGTTGPEGSVLTLLVLALVALVIHLTVRKPDEDLNVKG